jgi:hypothetical protein
MTSTGSPMPPLRKLIAEQVERGRDPARARRRAVKILAKLNREAEENEARLRRGEPHRTYSGAA